MYRPRTEQHLHPHARAPYPLIRLVRGSLPCCSPSPRPRPTLLSSNRTPTLACTLLLPSSNRTYLEPRSAECDGVSDSALCEPSKARSELYEEWHVEKTNPFSRAMSSTTPSTWSYADQDHWHEWDNRDHSIHGWTKYSNECFDPDLSDHGKDALRNELKKNPDSYAYPGQSPINFETSVLDELEETHAAYFNLSDSFGKKRSGLEIENTGTGLRVVG
jgi:hypothetical protein